MNSPSERGHSVHYTDVDSIVFLLHVPDFEIPIRANGVLQTIFFSATVYLSAKAY